MIVFGGAASLLSELTGVSEPLARLLSLAYTVPLAVLAVLGIPYWWRRDRAFTWLVLLYCVHVWHGAWRRGLFAVSRTCDYALRDPVWRRRRVAA